MGEGGISRCRCVDNIKMDVQERRRVKIATGLVWLGFCEDSNVLSGFLSREKFIASWS
jgi:hypothetical protein